MPQMKRSILIVIAMLAVALPAHAQGLSLDLANRDTTCAPCKDFFQYANGTWLAKTEIPSSYAGYGSFLALSDHNRDVLHTLLDDAVKKTTATDGNEGLLRTFYMGCMDSVRAEADGAKPLQPVLAHIAALKDMKDVSAEVAHLSMRGANVMFRFGVAPDFKNSTMNIANAGQGGLGMPDRDYYTKTDSVSAHLRDEYVAHVERSLVLAGVTADAAKQQAGRIMTIETSLANASMNNVQRRDPNAVYHKMSTADFETLAPNFEWGAFLEAAG